jgi:hypothetical protein
MMMKKFQCKTISDEAMVVINVPAKSADKARQEFERCLRGQGISHHGKVWVHCEDKDFNPEPHFLLNKEMLARHISDKALN